MELPGFFVGLFFSDDSDAHVTLMIRKHCTVADLQKMVNYLRFEIAPMLPLVVSINPEIVMKGKELDVPTHDVHFTDNQAREQLSKLYSEMCDPDSPFPNWSPHVTVDTDQKRQAVKKSGGLAVLKMAHLRQLGFKDSLFSIEK
jgi:hypothetical protein